MKAAPPPCPSCGKRETLPSENPAIWFCANCLDHVRIKAAPRLALFIPEHTPDGTFYHPANKVAVAACREVKRCIIPESVLADLRSLGYDLAATNGQPIGRVDVVA